LIWFPNLYIKEGEEGEEERKKKEEEEPIWNPFPKGSLVCFTLDRFGFIAGQSELDHPGAVVYNSRSTKVEIERERGR
jgi:hypothetical protein